MCTLPQVIITQYSLQGVAVDTKHAEEYISNTVEKMVSIVSTRLCALSKSIYQTQLKRWYP